MDDKSPLEDDLAEIVQQTSLFAASVVTKYLAPEGVEDGTQFRLGDATAWLTNDAPQFAISCAAYLSAVDRLGRAGEAGNPDSAINAALVAGMLTVEVWLAADKGRGFAEVMAEIGSRSVGGENSRILTPLQKADAKRWFAEIRPTVPSDNAAAIKVRRKLIEVHKPRREPSLMTVKRAIGLVQQ